jgi:hypothetical protein
MLQCRSPVATLRAAGALAQSITRRIGAPANYYRHQSHWRVVQALFAIDPGPAVAALKLRKRWTWPRRLPLGARAAASIPMIERNYSKYIVDHADMLSRRAMLDPGASSGENVISLTRG